MTNFLIELFATLIYMFVLFPMFLILNLFFMILVVLLLPVKIPMVKMKIERFLERRSFPGYNIGCQGETWDKPN